MCGKDWIFTSMAAAAFVALFGCDAMLPLGGEPNGGARPTRTADEARPAARPDTTAAATRTPSRGRDETAAARARERPVARSDGPRATTARPDRVEAAPETTTRTPAARAAPERAPSPATEAAAVARTESASPGVTVDDRPAGQPEVRTEESLPADATAADAVAPTTAQAAPAQPAEGESGGSVWAWLLGIVFMGGVAFGAWLLLQPPWKRWRWYWALRAGMRRQWLKCFGKNDGEGKAPKRDSARLLAAKGAAAKRPIPESQVETMVKKPAPAAPPAPPAAKKEEKKPSQKYGAPLKSRDTGTVRTRRTNVQVVDDAGKKAKRKKRQTRATIPAIPLTKKNPNKN